MSLVERSFLSDKKIVSEYIVPAYNFDIESVISPKFTLFMALYKLIPCQQTENLLDRNESCIGNIVCFTLGSEIQPELLYLRNG